MHREKNPNCLSDVKYRLKFSSYNIIFTCFRLMAVSLLLQMNQKIFQNLECFSAKQTVEMMKTRKYQVKCFKITLPEGTVVQATENGATCKVCQLEKILSKEVLNSVRHLVLFLFSISTINMSCREIVLGVLDQWVISGKDQTGETKNRTNRIYYQNIRNWGKNAKKSNFLDSLEAFQNHTLVKFALMKDSLYYHVPIFY